METISSPRAECSPGQCLLMLDGQKRLIEPRFKQKERESGLLPRNIHSPFGDFPGFVSQKKTSTRESAYRYDSEVKSHKDDGDIDAISSPRQFEFIKARTGTGGMTSSLRHVSPPRLPPPPKCDAFKKQKVKPSIFRQKYCRGDIPVSMEHSKSGKGIKWHVEIAKLDIHHYLPLFFDGLREKEDPYRFLAVQGTHDLLSHPHTDVAPVVPQLIIPIKEALNTKDPDVIACAIKAIQTMVLCNEGAGVVLVPYYKQILPIFNLFAFKNCNLGDKFEYSQRMRVNLGDLIAEALELMEKSGGPNAYKNIKYMIPTYQSAVIN